MPHLETSQVILGYCYIVKNNFQHNTRVLYTFIPNKRFGQLLDISPKNFIFLKPFKSEFPHIEVWSKF